MKLAYEMFALSLISVLFSAAGSAVAQETDTTVVIISEKVGEQIEFEEREKYNLFPGIQGFESAVLYKTPDNKYFFKIDYVDNATGEKKILRSPIIQEAVNVYRKHIDHFGKRAAESQSGIVQKKSSVGYDFSAGIGFGEDRYDQFALILINAELSLGQMGLCLDFLTFPFEDLLTSANLIVKLARPEGGFVPFGTVGIGACMCDTGWINLGGGLIIRLGKNLRIRTEVREWGSFGEGSFTALLVGLTI